MKRLIIVLTLVAAGLAGLDARHTALAAPGGNAAAAHASPGTSIAGVIWGD